MAKELTASGAYPLGARPAGGAVCHEEAPEIDSLAGKIGVLWARSRTSSTSSIRRTCRVLLCSVSGPEHQIGHALPVRDILGTLPLEVAAGTSRHAHVNAMGSDEVSPNLLGMGRVCSYDSVRRTTGRMEE